MIDKLEGACLVASQKMFYDVYLSEAVIFLYENSWRCTRGLVLNRPVDSKVFKDGGIGWFLSQHGLQMADRKLLAGGPLLRDDVFVIMAEQAAGGYRVEAASAEQSIDFSLVQDAAVGSVVWPPGAVDSEIRRGLWEVVPVQAGEIFTVPHAQRRAFAYQALGAGNCIVANSVGRA